MISIDTAPSLLQKYENAVAAIRKAVLRDGCPGLIVGLSGTDSALAFYLCYEALKPLGMADRLWGIHYGVSDVETGNPRSPKMRALYEWLRDKTPGSRLDVINLLEQKRPNDDQERWADLRRQSVIDVKEHGPWDAGQNYWVISPRNKTETILGNVSLDSIASSVAPVKEFYKSEILGLCAVINVPPIVMEGSRIPDCLCGREEIAADNIELIDTILMIKAHEVDAATLEGQDKTLLQQLDAHIHEKTLNNHHKQQFIKPEIGLSSYEIADDLKRLGEASWVDKKDSAAKIFGMTSVSLPLLATLAECCRIAGNLNFSFPLWRFWSMGLGEASLFEQAGMQRLRRATDTLDASLPEPHKDLYGAGFVRETDAYYIEYRRAYLAVHIKGDEPFSLLVRNNSPYFGVDRLPSSVVYSSRLKDVEEVRNLKPHDLTGGKWTPIERLLTDRDNTPEYFTSRIKDALNVIIGHEEQLSDYLISDEGLAALNSFLARKADKAPSPVFMGLLPYATAPWTPTAAFKITGGVCKPQIELPAPRGLRYALFSSPHGDLPQKPR